MTATLEKYDGPGRGAMAVCQMCARRFSGSPCRYPCTWPEGERAPTAFVPAGKPREEYARLMRWECWAFETDHEDESEVWVDPGDCPKHTCEDVDHDGPEPTCPACMAEAKRGA